MNGVVLLLYCVSALLYGADGRDQNETSPSMQPKNSSVVNSTSSLTSPVPNSPSENSSMMTSTITALTSQHMTPTTTTTSTEVSHRRGCVVAYLVNGGLILVCTILLVSIVLLLWKVWQLRQRLKALSSNGDLISNCEYRMGTARKNKGKPEVEAKETVTMLMSDFSQTQEDVGNDNNEEEEGGKGEAGENKDGQEGEEKNKGVVAASSSSSSEAAEKPKDAV